MSSTNAPPDQMVGRAVLARYRVVRVLAHGGMGVLYLGRTEGAAGFSKPVVIKRILPHLIANPRMAGLFVREAHILSELQHQGIVSILDFGEEESAYVMVLEFMRGYDLGLWHRYLRDSGGLLNGDVALQIMIRVLEALHYAHTFARPDGRQLGIVHRDVSPGNVLLDTEGHVKLLDFGIARFQDDAGEYRTRSGEFKGKAAYTPPEAFRGVEATAQADIFSAGVVLYKMLAGFNPFEGENAAQTMKRVTDLIPGPISQIRSDLKKDLDGVLQKALAKRPEQRFASAADFAEALRKCRKGTEEEAIARLIADVQRDFLGDMPSRLGLESLAVLDASWRSPSTGDLHALFDTKPNENDPTAAGGRATPVRPPARRPSPVLLGVGAVVVLGALGFGAWGLLGSGARGPEPPPFVVVQKNETRPPTAPTPSAPAPAPTPTAPVAAPVPIAPLAPEPGVSPGSTPVQPRRKIAAVGPDANALTRSFRKQRVEIERCFQQNAKAIEGQPEIAIAFRVDRTGTVQSAETVPATLGETPLGKCLLDIAQRTAFGPQDKDLSFRIPLRARQSGDAEPS